MCGSPAKERIHVSWLRMTAGRLRVCVVGAIGVVDRQAEKREQIFGGVRDVPGHRGGAGLCCFARDAVEGEFLEESLARRFPILIKGGGDAGAVVVGGGFADEEHVGLDLVARGFVFRLDAGEQAGDDETECECGG